MAKVGRWSLVLMVLAGCAVGPVGGVPPVDVTVTLATVGASAWQVSQVEGGGVGNPSGDNPSLTLEIGTRYRFVNPNRAFHPFELLTLGAAPGDDVVLLSEDADGSFENDPAVDFEDDGSGVSFTLTPALAAALSGYRCSIHTQAMRGTIVTVATP